MDQRVGRTRERLQGALTALTADKPYEEIDVEEICRRAGVARSTFYTHFTGKDDLKRASLDAILLAGSGGCHQASIGGSWGFILTLLHHVRECRKHYLTPDGTGGAALGAVRQTVISQLQRVVKAGLTRSASSRDFAIQFLAGAFMTMVTAWIERGAREEPEVIAEAFQRMSDAALLTSDAATDATLRVREPR